MEPDQLVHSTLLKVGFVKDGNGYYHPNEVLHCTFCRDGGLRCVYVPDLFRIRQVKANTPIKDIAIKTHKCEGCLPNKKCSLARRDVRYGFDENAVPFIQSVPLASVYGGARQRTVDPSGAETRESEEIDREQNDSQPSDSRLNNKKATSVAPSNQSLPNASPHDTVPSPIGELSASTAPQAGPSVAPIPQVPPPAEPRLTTPPNPQPTLHPDPVAPFPPTSDLDTQQYIAPLHNTDHNPDRSVDTFFSNMAGISPLFGNENGQAGTYHIPQCNDSFSSGPSNFPQAMGFTNGQTFGGGTQTIPQMNNLSTPVANPRPDSSSFPGGLGLGGHSVWKGHERPMKRTRIDPDESSREADFARNVNSLFLRFQHDLNAMASRSFNAVIDHQKFLRESVEGELNEMKQKLEVEEKSRAQAKKELAAVETEREEEKKTAKEQVSRLQKEANVRDEQIEQLKKTVATRDKKAAVDKVELGRLERELATSNERVKAAEAEVKAVQGEYAQLKESIDSPS